MRRDAEIREAVGAAVKVAREARGLSVKELARLADLDWSMVYRIERGDSGAMPATLERIAHELGLTLPDLFARALAKRRIVRRHAGRRSSQSS